VRGARCRRATGAAAAIGAVSGACGTSGGSAPVASSICRVTATVATAADTSGACGASRRTLPTSASTHRSAATGSVVAVAAVRIVGCGPPVVMAIMDRAVPPMAAATSRASTTAVRRAGVRPAAGGRWLDVGWRGGRPALTAMAAGVASTANERRVDGGGRGDRGACMSSRQRLSCQRRLPTPRLLLRVGVLVLVARCCGATALLKGGHSAGCATQSPAGVNHPASPRRPSSTGPTERRSWPPL